MGHSTRDTAISSCDVYGFNILIIKIVKVEILVVFGRLKEINVTLIYGFSKIGLGNRLAHFKVGAKVLVASLHRIVLILALFIWMVRSIEVHGHCSISNWQSFSLIKLFELLWVFILIFLSLLSDGRQGAELSFITSRRFSDIINSTGPILFLLLKIFTGLGTKSTIWINESDFKIMSSRFQFLKIFIVPEHILSVFFARCQIIFLDTLFLKGEFIRRIRLILQFFLLLFFQGLSLIFAQPISLSIFCNDLGSKTLMSFETGLVIGFLFQVFVGPLILHLGLEVLADLKVGDLLFECLFHQNLVDVFEVNLIGHTFISLNFVILKDFKNILIFYYDHFFVFNEEGIFIVH